MPWNGITESASRDQFGKQNSFAPHLHPCFPGSGFFLKTRMANLTMIPQLIRT